MDEIYLSEQLAALGHVTRLRVVKELLAAPHGMPAGKLAGRQNMRQNSLSPHLASLARNNLISGVRTGREVIYAAHVRNLSVLAHRLHALLTAPDPDGKA